MTPIDAATPPLETERLRLRAYRPEDFPAFATFYADPVSRFVGGPCAAHEAWRLFAYFAGHAAIRGYGAWALEEKASGAYVGHVALWNPESWPEPEVGWILLPAAQGAGYATEAARRARAYAYEALGWDRLVSCVDPANQASQRVVARLGGVFDYDYAHPDGRQLRVYAHPTPTALKEGAAA